MKTAILVLGFLALASIAGTMLAQNLPAETYITTFGTFWSAVIFTLQLDSLFTAWWFLGLLLFLLVSVTSCLWVNGPKIFKNLLRPRLIPSLKQVKAMPQATGLKNTSLDKVISFLQGEGFKITHQGKDMTGLVRGHFNRVGYFLVHIGVVLVALSGLITAFSGYRATMNLYPNEVDNRAVIYKGDAATMLHLPFDVRNDGFEIDFYSNGMPKAYRTRLTFLQNGEVKKQAVTSVNSPAKYKGVTFYQASFGDGGSQVELVIRNLYTPDKTVYVDKAHIYQKIENKDGYEVELRDLHLRSVEQFKPEEGIVTRFTDTGPTLDYILRGPDIQPMQLRSYLNYPHIIGLGDGEGNYTPTFLGLDITKDKGWDIVGHALYNSPRSQSVENFANLATPLLQNYPKNQRLDLALKTMNTTDILKATGIPYVVQLVNFDQKYYTGLQVAYDPGAMFFWWSCLKLLLGVVGMLSTSYHRVWVTQSGKTVWVGSPTTTRKHIMQGLFKKLEASTNTN